MTKRERVESALSGRNVDRIPYSVYVHSTVHERTVERFTEFTLDFHKTFDPDYVKVMFDWNYETPTAFQFVSRPEQWEEFEVIDPHIGAFGLQIEALKRIKRTVGDETPVIQTIYSPFHFALRIAGRGHLIEQLGARDHRLPNALDVIAKSLVAFIKSAREEAGIDGIFFAAQGCEESWMDEASYESTVSPSDRAVLEEVEDLPIRMLHIHAENHSHFELLRRYPCNALSFEDRVAGPSLKEARRRTDKCLVGGIDHKRAVTASPSDIVEEGREAISQVGGTGLILAPGCTFLPGTPRENMHALSDAVGG